MTKYTSAQVRIYLKQALRTDSDFNGFCIDHFPDASRRFSDSMDRVAKCNLLFELVGDPDLILKKLLLTHPEIIQSTSAQYHEKSTNHKLKTGKTLYIIVAATLMSGFGLILSFTNRSGGSSAVDLASKGQPILLADLTPAILQPVPHPEQPGKSAKDSTALRPKALKLGQAAQVAALPRQCDKGFVYYADLAAHGLSPCVQLPRVILASSCSCDVGTIGKRCMLSGFSDVIGNVHLGGSEEQIRNEYRERGFDLCQAMLKGCRQTKDENERYACYCCPE
jgi:hypothetical protein